MVAALMSLSAYGCKSCPYDAVLALEIVDRKICISRVIVDDFGLLSGMAVDLLLPVFSVFKFNIVKARFEVICLSKILDSLERSVVLERKLRKRRSLAARIEERNGLIKIESRIRRSLSERIFRNRESALAGQNPAKCSGYS